MAAGKMSSSPLDRTRRRLLAATAVLGGAGSLAALYPMVCSFLPPEQAGEEPRDSLEVDISDLRPGQMKTLEWAGKPIWVLRRSQEMQEGLVRETEGLLDPHSQTGQQPRSCQNPTRSIRPEILVLVGLCTHLGCVPVPKLKRGEIEGGGTFWTGGFLCPCHGAKFDLAGRVFKNSLAPRNMEVPPHVYLAENRILIGVEDKES